MRNLHKYYYKDYFSLQDISINHVDRHLDYELLIDDEKKKRFENQIKDLETQKKGTQGRQKEQLETQITEIKAKIAVNVNVLKARNKVLTGNEFAKKDQQGKPTRELLNDAEINLDKAITSGDGYDVIPLNIQYPGLVTGVGIDHETKIEGEFKLGVHFDWTHGMPVIYGSSVKGVLRSAFISKMGKGKIVEYDDYFLKKVTGRNWEQKEIEALFDAIFEGKDAGRNNLSIYERDIFFDAVITKPDKKGRILCADSITPHGDNPLKNPTPLTFMKIAPGCEIQFRFKLTNNGLPKDKKKELFKKILTTLGIGAKTNVGYGQLK